MHTFFTVTAKQINILQGGCYETARKEWHRLRAVLQLKEKEPLRLRDLAAAWDAPVESLAETLYEFKKKPARQTINTN
jgi:hypothetical protein